MPSTRSSSTSRPRRLLHSANELRSSLAGTAFGSSSFAYQLAPLLVIATNRPRHQFVADVPAILAALDPHNNQAATFEGFYLEARDDHGPFVRTDTVTRGTIEGGQWSADPNDYPFAHG